MPVRTPTTWLVSRLALAVLALLIGAGPADAGSLGAARAAMDHWQVPPVPQHLSPVSLHVWEGTNPTLGQKVLGYDDWVRANGSSPDLLVLGSSRALGIDPAVIAEASGRRAFNAAMSNGTAPDMLAMASYADLRSAAHMPRLLVFVDVETFNGRRGPTKRVRDYLRRIQQVRAACGDPEPCAPAWLDAAGRIARDARRRQVVSRPYRETQNADGVHINDVMSQLAARGADMRAIRNHRIRQRIASYAPGEFDHVYAPPEARVGDPLRLANARGVEPVLVLTPMHPDCIRICGPAGWNARHRDVRRVLSRLQTTARFTWHDATDPATWGGSGADFYDEVHLRPAGSARFVRWLVSEGAVQ